ncbi:MAG: hypothetical protein EA357_03585 [Micavibrio sp.]|nr:MAG: hypothetical protein EA357_03585 [Micavibrio sp.]
MAHVLTTEWKKIRKTAGFALFFSVFVLFGMAGAAAQVTLTPLNDIEIGTVGKTANATGNITIDTFGSISCDAGFECPSAGVPGRFQATGPTGDRMRVRCEDRTKNLRNSTGTDGELDREANEIYVRLGSGNPVVCGGGWAFNTHFSADPAENIIYVGMRFVGTDARLNGLYSMGAHPDGEFEITVRRQGGGNPSDTASIDGFISLEGILEIADTSNMDFGIVEVASQPPSAGDFAAMGSNGNISYGGSFSGAGSGTVGTVTLQGAATGDIIEVFCSQSARMTNPSNTAQIDVNGIEFGVLNALGNYGTGFSCNGLATPATSGPFIPVTQDTVFIGGRIDGATASGVIDSNFSTANPGGEYIEFQFIKQ